MHLWVGGWGKCMCAWNIICAFYCVFVQYIAEFMQSHPDVYGAFVICCRRHSVDQIVATVSFWLFPLWYKHLYFTIFSSLLGQIFQDIQNQCDCH